MFRVDFESSEPVSAALGDALLARLEAALPGTDVVCLEDYNKGVCAPELCRAVIEKCRRAGVPVLVDPAHIEDYTKYRGCTAITPNRSEAELATGLATAQAGDGSADAKANTRLAERLMQILEAQAVVLTLDRHGALLLERGGPPMAVPTVAREVYDVTGAGDMMLAALAAARANEIPWPDAVRFANAAAGLEVEVFGVVPIPLAKIHLELQRRAAAQHYSGGAGKLLTPELADVEIAARRAAGQRIVFTNGCFDVLHSGHVSLLERAASMGEFLIVGLNDDASVRRLKGASRPVNPQNERARVLGALGCVGAVVLFEQDTPLELIRRLRPDVLVKGADYTPERVVGAAEVRSWGGRVELVDLVPGVSTTGTIARMKTGTP